MKARRNRLSAAFGSNPIEDTFADGFHVIVMFRTLLAISVFSSAEYQVAGRSFTMGCNPTSILAPNAAPARVALWAMHPRGRV
jgi:hypothetical protein